MDATQDVAAGEVVAPSSEKHLTGPSDHVNLYPGCVDKLSMDQPDWVCNSIIHEELAAVLLAQFQTTQSRFPFVIIPSEWSPQHMQREHPFLLLVIMTSMVKTNPLLGLPEVSEALERELNTSLARRLITTGEQDLDLLQGLLVHLAW